METDYGIVPHTITNAPQRGMPHREGYLLKRSTSNNHRSWKNWKRRWASLENGKLFYRKKASDVHPLACVHLMLSTVRPARDSNKRFCFEIISTSPNKTYQLQV